MQYLIEDIRNNFNFFLRNLITLSRKNYSKVTQDFSGIFENEEQEKFYNILKNKYGNLLSINTTQSNFLLNLYYLNIFDKYFSQKTKKNASILDIGSKNWEYVKSEFIFFKSFLNNFSLDGIELDAYRMCSNFYTRYEIAQFYTKDLPNTNYIQGDFIKHKRTYDYIIWILPFITKKPLVKWGLPLKYFKPQEMLIHAYSLLNLDGELLIINQGEEEYAIQQELVSKMDTEKIYLPLGEIEDSFGFFKNKRYCSKLIKTT